MKGNAKKRLLAILTTLSIASAGIAVSNVVANKTANQPTAITAQAASTVETWGEDEVGEGLTATLDSDGTLTISGKGEMKGCPWRSSHQDEIKKVVIQNGVTIISSWAFAYCSSLTSIVIPNSVTSISSWVFYGCSSLTSVNIPRSVTDIGDLAFSYCELLTKIEIPMETVRIGYSVFKGCDSLIIYAEAPSKMGGWDSSWNYSECPVVWDHKMSGCSGSIGMGDIAATVLTLTTATGVMLALTRKKED